MISGLYAAANGMISMEDRQAIIANNIANAATPGFRRQEGVLKGFYEVLLGELGSAQRYDQSTSPGGGITLDQSFTDLAGGPIGTTGNPLDVAIAGPGYFVVETPAGQRFTRNGRFTVDAEGELATSDGY